MTLTQLEKDVSKLLAKREAVKVQLLRPRAKTGRKRLNIPFKNIYDTLRVSPDVMAAAVKLGCSRGYIYMRLREHGLNISEVLGNGRAYNTCPKCGGFFGDNYGQQECVNCGFTK